MVRDGSLTMDPVDLPAWILEHAQAIDSGAAGPVMSGELTALVVRGRGPRRDFHINHVAELFYQIDGDITVTVRTDDGATHEVAVPTGGLWLAPAGVPHSPQRPAGTLGLVVERAREPGRGETFRWYCDACGLVVHDIVMPAVDPASLRRSMVAFYADEAARTCAACGHVIRKPGE